MTVDVDAPQGEVPAVTEPPAQKRHRCATALACLVGAVVFACAGIVVGTLMGPQWLRAYLPSVASELNMATTPTTMVEQLEDGYSGELVRRIAAVGNELERSAYEVPTLEEATAGALQGLLSASDPYALYVDAEAYGSGKIIASDDETPPVHSRLVDGVGIVVVDALMPGVAEDVAAQMEALRDEGAQGFVLDLRSNPGGSLHEAVMVASLFLEGGTVVEVIHADGSSERIAANPGDTVMAEPLVVLVSSDTGSAAEALAAALQDHHRALLVGSVTAGRGGVQVVKTLSFGGAVVYATSMFRTPDGYVVEGRGIAPDLVLPMEGASRSDDPATDAQVAAAFELLAQWAQTGSMDQDGLSNAPGPQADGVDQARALERAMQQESSPDESSQDDGSYEEMAPDANETDGAEDNETPTGSPSDETASMLGESAEDSSLSAAVQHREAVPEA